MKPTNVQQKKKLRYADILHLDQKAAKYTTFT